MGKARDLARVIVDSGGLIATANLGNAVPADGSITNEKIASVAASKLTGQVPFGNATSGSVINVTTYTNGSMITASSSANLTYFSFNVTKKSSSSILLVHGSIPTGGSENHGIYWFVSFGASRVFRGIADGWRWHGTTTTEITNPGGIHINTVSPSGISAGTVSVGFGIQPADGGANRPYIRLNPDSGVDSRNNNGTNLIVYEVQL